MINGHICQGVFELSEGNSFQFQFQFQFQFPPRVEVVLREEALQAPRVEHLFRLVFRIISVRRSTNVVR